MKVLRESGESIYSDFINDLLSILKFKDKVEIYPRANGFEIINRIGRSAKFSRLTFRFTAGSLDPRIVYFRNTAQGSPRAYDIVMTFDKPVEELTIDDAENLANKLEEFPGFKSLLK